MFCWASDLLKLVLACAKGSLGSDIPNGTISLFLYKGKNHGGNPQMSLDVMVRKHIKTGLVEHI